MNPLISIIIPTYNRAHLIGETLDSLLAQTYTKWECIIVDDGSNDGTEEIIKEYNIKDSRFQYHQRPKDRKKGPNACRNYGFAVSKGNWINWMDSDDTYKPNALMKVMKFYAKNIDAIVVKLDWINSVSKQKIGENKLVSDNLLEDYFVGKITFYVSGPFWNRDFLKGQNDLFDDKIRYLDDWDFNLRMLYCDPNVVFINESLILYNLSKDSLSHQINYLVESEVFSEINARDKHLELIARNKKIELKNIQIFVRDRYKNLLRNCLLSKHNCSYTLMKRMTVLNWKILDIKCLFKTILGYFIYFFFGRGDKCFK
jgi:glycosyltransferase involved in cell wall biosynthesis